MAEREGFEPSIQFPVYTLSKRAPSTTRPSLLRLLEDPPATDSRAQWRVLRQKAREENAFSAILTLPKADFEILSSRRGPKGLGWVHFAFWQAQERTHEPSESLQAGMTTVRAQAHESKGKVDPGLCLGRVNGTQSTPRANGRHIEHVI